MEKNSNPAKVVCSMTRIQGNTIIQLHSITEPLESGNGGHVKVWMWENGKVREQKETDGIDIWTKRYTIRIRISGILIIRHARPKKNKPEKEIYNKDLRLY